MTFDVVLLLFTDNKTHVAIIAIIAFGRTLHVYIPEHHSCAFYTNASREPQACITNQGQLYILHFYLNELITQPQKSEIKIIFSILDTQFAWLLYILPCTNWSLCPGGQTLIIDVVQELSTDMLSISCLILPRCLFFAGGCIFQMRLICSLERSGFLG